MRILHVIPWFSPEFGGSVSVITQLTRELVNHGHEVTIITSDLRFDKKSADAAGSCGITVIPFRTVANLGLFVYTPSMNRWLRKNIRNFDCIHMHTFRSYQNMCAFHCAAKHNIPYIVQAHGGILPIFEKQGLKKMYDTAWGYALLKNASDNLACSKNESDQCRLMGVDENKIRIIPTCLDTSEFRNLPQKGSFKTRYGIGPEEKVILFLGRIHKIKGIDLLIDAFYELSKEMDNIRLVIAGPDGGFLEALVNQAAELDIQKKIIFTGGIYSSDKHAAYVDADVYVLPSRYEVFGLTVLEAWACGTPVLLSEGCLISEFLPDKKIIFGSDKDQMKDLIKKLLQDDEFRLRVTNEGKQLLSGRFSWSANIAHYIDCYSEAGLRNRGNTIRHHTNQMRET
jgi:glycosyltransferase involved in cell wall biosynthesis